MASQVHQRFHIAISRQLRELLARKVGNKNIQQLAVELLAAYVGRKDLAGLGESRKTKEFEMLAEVGIVKFSSGDHKGIREILNAVGQLIFLREITLCEKYLRYCKNAIDGTPSIHDSIRELYAHMADALQTAKENLSEEQVWAWMPGPPESAGEFAIRCPDGDPQYVRIESPADLADLPPVVSWHLKLPPTRKKS